LSDVTETVSVVIPAFNAERFVAEAVDSVLAQTYSPVECIVVDDGSSDSTAEVVRGYGPAVRLIQHENQGVAATRNLGAAQADGKLIAFLDADDLWEPTLLDRQLPRLQDIGAVAVTCAMRVVDRQMCTLRTIRAEPFPTRQSMLLQEGPVAGPVHGMIIRRAVFDAIGGFDDELSTSADWDFLFRLLAHGVIAYVDEPLFIYRPQPNSMSLDIELMERDMLLAYNKAFEREVELRPIQQRAYARLHWMIGGSYWDDRKVLPAARHVVSALVRDPSLSAKLARALRGRAQSISPSK
jgi:glycosyltransferase involved in cell wall biosynthesis